MAEEKTIPNPPVKFHPIGDQVLVRLDVKDPPALAIRPEKKVVLPSGRVVAVSPRYVVPGVGWVETVVKVGDHVALVLERGGPWRALPLSGKDSEIYVTISESSILGRLQGADETSPWFVDNKDDGPSGLIVN